MNKTVIWLPLLVAGVLLILALYYVLPGAGTARSEFGTGSGDEISKVILTQGDERVVYLERQEEEWFLNHEYMANMPAVRDLLSTLRRVEIRRPVSVASRDETAAEIKKGGVRVDVFVGGYRINLPGGEGVLPYQKRIRSFMVWEDQDGNKTYMMQAGSSYPYEVHIPGVLSGIGEVFEPDLHLWKDAVVVRLGNEEVAGVKAEFPGREEASYTLEMNNGEYTLRTQAETIYPERIDSSRVEQFVGGFAYLYYERLLPGSENDPPEDILNENEFLRLEVSDQTGNNTNLWFYRRLPPGDGSLVSELRDHDPNRFYLRVDGGDYALAQYFVFQPVIRDIQWFITD